MAKLKLSADDKHAIMTTVNTGILLILFRACEWIFQVDITPENITRWIPVFAVVVGIFMRLSLYIADRWPPVGYVLFGIKEKPDIPHRKESKEIVD